MQRQRILVGAKLVRLTGCWDLDNPGRDLRNEAACDLDGRSTPSLIAVQEQDNLLKALLQKLLLPERKGASHQCNHAGQARLMDVETITKSFDDHDVLSAAAARLQIEEREAIFGNEAGNRYFGSV